MIFIKKTSIFVGFQNYPSLLFLNINSTLYQFTMQFRRRLGQTKKQFHRRMAHNKKQIWATLHNQQDEDFKAHFSAQDEDSCPDSSKSKKISKSQYKTEQRLRNRVAAQESRERHRSYVQELERKVRMYEELFEKDVGLCRNCKKNIQNDTQSCSSMLGQSMSQPPESSSLPKEIKEEEEAYMTSFLQEQTIRIDNNGATTPFSVFFIICIVAVLAIFSFSTPSESVSPRLLTNYHETLNNIIHYQDDIIGHQLRLNLQKNSKLLESTIPIHPIDQNPSSRRPDESASSNMNWTKYGKYICSEPEQLLDMLDRKKSKEKRHPEFVLLRTGKNSSKLQQKKQNNEGEQESYEIMPKYWEKLEISTCFLDEM